jgi:biotin/methionine sulfoxide reductase
MNKKKYPLHLISNQPKNKLHSQMDHGKYSKSFKIKDREPVEINLKDASARNIKDGDVVKLFNNRGACLAGAIVSEKVRPGVVQISTGAWYDPENPLELNSLCKHGNPNVLTPDKGTSKLGQGPIAHSCLIEIERFTDKVPKVTAHMPPNIIRKK